MKVVADANHIIERSNLIIKRCHEVLSSVLEYWVLDFLRNLLSLNVFLEGEIFMPWGIIFFFQYYVSQQDFIRKC